MPDIIFDLRNKIPILKNLYLDIHESISECNLYKSTWPASSVSLKQPLGARFHFWHEKWNPDSEKPIFIPPWKHITVWPFYLFSLQRPSCARFFICHEKWNSDPKKLYLDIQESILESDLQRRPGVKFIFDMRNKILIKIHLDIFESISESTPSSYVPSQVQGSASSGLQVADIIFDIKNQILTLNNLYFDIH